MTDVIPFLELIRRVRAGDQQASAELVRLYEPAIRVAVHARLTGIGLRRVFDSMDICQSVLGAFFHRAAAGQFTLDRSEQLIHLLAVMARNRLTNHAQRHQAARRDHRRNDQNYPAEALADGGPSPSEVASGNELLAELRSRLTPAEARLAEQCAAGEGWPAIAAETGGSPDGLRMRLSRALRRVARELRLAD